MRWRWRGANLRRRRWGRPAYLRTRRWRRRRGAFDLRLRRCSGWWRRQRFHRCSGGRRWLHRFHRTDFRLGRGRRRRWRRYPVFVLMNRSGLGLRHRRLRRNTGNACRWGYDDRILRWQTRWLFTRVGSDPALRRVGHRSCGRRRCALGSRNGQCVGLWQFVEFALPRRRRGWRNSRRDQGHRRPCLCRRIVREAWRRRQFALLDQQHALLDVLG